MAFYCPIFYRCHYSFSRRTFTMSFSSQLTFRPTTSENHNCIYLAIVNTEMSRLKNHQLLIKNDLWTMTTLYWRNLIFSKKDNNYFKLLFSVFRIVFLAAMASYQPDCVSFQFFSNSGVRASSQSPELLLLWEGEVSFILLNRQ